MPEPALVVAIDCAPPGAVRWQLDAVQFDEPTCREIRDRVRALTVTL